MCGVPRKEKNKRVFFFRCSYFCHAPRHPALLVAPECFRNPAREKSMAILRAIFPPLSVALHCLRKRLRPIDRRFSLTWMMRGATHQRVLHCTDVYLASKLAKFYAACGGRRRSRVRCGGDVELRLEPMSSSSSSDTEKRCTAGRTPSSKLCTTPTLRGDLVSKLSIHGRR